MQLRSLKWSCIELWGGKDEGGTVTWWQEGRREEFDLKVIATLTETANQWMQREWGLDLQRLAQSNGSILNPNLQPVLSLSVSIIISCVWFQSLYVRSPIMYEWTFDIYESFMDSFIHNISKVSTFCCCCNVRKQRKYKANMICPFMAVTTLLCSFVLQAWCKSICVCIFGALKL